MIPALRLKKVAALLAIAALTLSCNVLSQAPTATPAPTPTRTTIPTATLTPTPEASPTPPGYPNAGHWEGEGVSFDVTQDGRVTNFSIELSDCIVKLGSIAVISEDYEFRFGTMTSSGPVYDGILGTFTSSTTMTGTNANPFTCSSVPGFSTTITWYGGTPPWWAKWVGP
ncbi:MAG: hypothetical protein HYZ26_05125 [Chloroflexi bacterium]|nr:hypothetical protein [Chloroflexota bacterium]